MKRVFNILPHHNIDLSVEDSGKAEIITVTDDNDDGVYVRIQSWSETCVHETMDEIRRAHKQMRAIRVTLEIDD